MPTFQRDNWNSGREHIRVADWTVGFHRILQTFVRVSHTNCQTHVAFVAVKKVNVDALANTTEAAGMAVIN
jgi:hypothetical protein